MVLATTGTRANLLPACETFTMCLHMTTAYIETTESPYRPQYPPKNATPLQPRSAGNLYGHLALPVFQRCPCASPQLGEGP